MIATCERAPEGRFPTTPDELYDALETDRTFRTPFTRPSRVAPRDAERGAWEGVL